MEMNYPMQWNSVQLCSELQTLHVLTILTLIFQQIATIYYTQMRICLHAFI